MQQHVANTLVLHGQIAVEAPISYKFDVALNLLNRMVIVSCEITSYTNQPRCGPVHVVSSFLPKLLKNQPLEVLLVIHQPVQIK